MVKRIIDLAQNLAEGPAVYPGDPEPKLGSMCDIGDESPCAITTLDGLTTHTGTHVDAPSHFIAGGDTLADIPLDRFHVPAVVIDVRGKTSVTVNEVNTVNLATGVAVLLCTGGINYTENSYDQNHAFLEVDAAKYLVGVGATVVGIDTPSIDSGDSETFDVHTTLLGGDVLIVEGLVTQGLVEALESNGATLTLSAFPLSLGATDGSPARVVLIEEVS